MKPILEFSLTSSVGTSVNSVTVNRAIVAGWTGRDLTAIEKHIIELEEIGVKRPTRTPIFYRVSSSRVNTGNEIEVIGSASTGEVEFVVVNIEDTLWIGVGSDHTDREAEVVGVTLSKQMCDKPMSNELWPLDELLAHWDSIELKSFATIGGERVPYQDGCVTAMLHPQDLLKKFATDDSSNGLQPGDVMMCGTLPVIGGVRSAERFDFELHDPIAERYLRHSYDIIQLPVEE